MSNTTTQTSTAAATPTAKSSSRPAKSKIVKLKLSSALLAKFAPVDAQSSSSSRSKSVSSASTPLGHIIANPTAEPTPVPNGADSNAASTPAASTNDLLAPPPNALKRKGVPGPKPGLKRTASQLDLNGVPKPRGKPGPKKKARIGENGVPLDGAPVPAPKLGPKANQGAINACLRALDRSGKPCRKWVKKPFAVKSFTGYRWGAGTYASLKGQSSFSGDVKSDSSSSGDKPTQESSALASEKSNSGADTETALPVDATNSPAPAQAISSAA